MIGTPTVSRIICEHVLQCFGFPKATPEAIEEIMSRVVMGNLKAFMKVTLTQFSAVSLASVAVAIPTLGIGSIIGGVGCILATPPTARMLFKCACDMILILERSFRYQGRYVSVKQIEDAAVYYTTAMTTTLSGKEILLQQHIHDEVDRLIPLKKVSIGFRFGRLRSGLQEIIYFNRFDRSASGGTGAPLSSVSSTELPADKQLQRIPELEAQTSAIELDTGAEHKPLPPPPPGFQELPGDNRHPQEMASPLSAVTATRSPSAWGGGDDSQSSEAAVTTLSSVSSMVTSPTMADDLSRAGTLVERSDEKAARTKSEGNVFKRSLSKWSLKKTKTGGG